jgi:uroporphyrinogen III methyltransferase/synthase
VRELADGRFDWLVLTSRAGVEALFERVRANDLTARRLSGSVAAVGDGTARALREHGVEPALVPRRFTTEALAATMPAGKGRLLLARADIAPDGMEDVLGQKGWTVERVDAYRTRFVPRLPPEARRALQAGTVDAVTFTSASTVDGFARQVGSAFHGGGLWRPGTRRRRIRVACIGPVTAARARERGLRVDAVARYHTVDGLVVAVERALRRAPGVRPTRSKERA